MYLTLLFFGILTSGIFAYLLLHFLLDMKKKRGHTNKEKISVIVPCYNDSESLEETIRSIFKIILPDELIVINDASTDNSLEILEKLQNKYSFKLISNEKNLGKPLSLNLHVPHAKNEIIFMIDSDVIVNSLAFKDVICRLSNSKVGAVSAPYISRKKGFLARMQAIEFNLLALIIGAPNRKSTLALWGGFLAIKKSAFLKVGKFSLNAINDDMDLAAKLNAANWKVEQSPFGVENHPPSTYKSFLKQKYRWNMGAIQCSLKHREIWNSHLLFSLFPLCYSVFSIILLFVFIFIGIQIVFQNIPLELASLTLLPLILSCLIFLPAVFPIVEKPTNFYLVFLVIPFMLIYLPCYTLISTASWIGFFFKREELKRSTRAW